MNGPGPDKRTEKYRLANTVRSNHNLFSLCSVVYTTFCCREIATPLNDLNTRRAVIVTKFNYHADANKPPRGVTQLLLSFSNTLLFCGRQIPEKRAARPTIKLSYVRR